jgi:hypothetical protein
MAAATHRPVIDDPRCAGSLYKPVADAPRGAYQEHLVLSRVATTTTTTTTHRGGFVVVRAR